MNKVWTNQKGAALPVVLGIIVVGTLVALVLLAFLFNEIHKSQTVSESIQAKYAAEAGAERMLSTLYDTEKNKDMIKLEPLSCSTDSIGMQDVNGYTIQTSCALTATELTLSSTASGETTHTTTVSLKVTNMAPLTLEVNSWN